MDKKIINNAISAYLGVWLLLLIPSKNENINNKFVKNHARTAVFIHFLFLISYIIFITYWFLQEIRIPVLDYNLNNLIVCILFIFLFMILLYWIYKAMNWNDFSIFEVKKMTRTENILEMKKSNLNEQWKLTIILSYIPFLWNYIYWKFYNYKSEIIINSVKLNFLITSFLTLLFLLWHSSLTNLFILFYIIFIIFLSVLLIWNENIINFNLWKIPTFKELEICLKSIFKYLKNYFWKNKFVNFKEIVKKEEENHIITEKSENEYLSNLKDLKLPKYLIYIPFINLITLFQFNSKYQFHIINWVLITLFSWFFIYLWNEYQILLLIPIFAWLWFLKKLEYKVPFIFSIYKTLINIIKKLFWIWKKIKAEKNKVEEISIKL